MTVYLLDVNVLIALLDPSHPFASPASQWFEGMRDGGWATCPITENGVIRIMSSPSFPAASANPVDHARNLRELCETGQHQFWPDDISLRDILMGDLRPTSAQIADLYLLALAIAHAGMLATFDRRIPTQLLSSGSDALELIHI